MKTFIEFNWLVYKVVQTFQRNYNLQNTEVLIVYIIIGDIHQFISYCLVPSNSLVGVNHETNELKKQKYTFKPEKNIKILFLSKSLYTYSLLRDKINIS